MAGGNDMKVTDIINTVTDLQTRGGKIATASEVNKLFKETKSTAQYNRTPDTLEVKTYEAAKERLDGVEFNPNDEESLKQISKEFKSITKEIAHQDQIGAVGQAIADKIAPVPKDTFGLDKLDEKYTGLYSETTKELVRQEIESSAEYKNMEMTKGINRSIAAIADVVGEMNYRDELTKKLAAEIGVSKKGEVVTGEVPPPVDQDRMIPDTTGNREVAPIGVFDTAKNKELNNGVKRTSRLKNLRSKLGGKTFGYFPNSKLKFEMNPTQSLIEKEELYAEMEKMYTSNGLKNMSKFITEASKYVNLIIGDSDKNLKHPGDSLRKKLHWNDFKHLLIYKAISAGESEVMVELDCPQCGEKFNKNIELLELAKSWSDEQFKNFEEYNADATYEDITKSWRKIEDTDVYAITGFETEDGSGLIYDDNFKAPYNKVFFTIKYEEPTIEKYMNIKNSAFNIMIYTFKDETPLEVGSDEQALMTYINQNFGERAVRLQSILESLAVIENIKISYVHEKKAEDGTVESVTVGEDNISISSLTALDIYDLINEQLDEKLTDKAREYLIRKYNLEDRAREIKLNQGYLPEDIEGMELEIPTLLEEMLFMDIRGIECPTCKHKFTSEASVLLLGFTAMQKLKQKTRY